MFKAGWRLATEVGARPLWKFAWNFGFQGALAVRRFERGLRRGEYFPAFLFISVTDQCNLSCQGCWVTPCTPARTIPPAILRQLLTTSRERGIRFFGILGGEPLLYPGLPEIFAEFPDCYFQLFTNGLLLDDDYARRLRAAANVTPLISIEGDALVSDERRGGTHVLARSLKGLGASRNVGLPTGVATSVCASNIEALATPEFIDRVVGEGAHYLWYYIYRPVGPRPCPELALTAEQILKLRRFMVDIRSSAPLAVIDSYWDHLGRAMCPAVLGLAPHIGPGGDVEPCPPIQFSDRSINDGGNPAATLAGSPLNERFRTDIAKLTRGCILMDNPQALRDLVQSCGAADSSGRGRALQELAAMRCCPSHHCPGSEIPEKSWFYRFAKRHWFFGFGAYG